MAERRKDDREDDDRARRIAAVARLSALEIEDVPDPDILSRQLTRTYEPLYPPPRSEER